MHSVSSTGNSPKINLPENKAVLDESTDSPVTIFKNAHPIQETQNILLNLKRKLNSD
jgi:hypothetical protein